MGASRELEVMKNALMKASGAISDRTAGTKANPQGVYDAVTPSDIGAENAIISEIRSEFPDDAIISEESSPDAEASSRSWVVDPIDGTVNFSRGIPLYGIQAAFLEDGVPKAAAIYLPESGEMFHATEEGAFLGDAPIHAAAPRPLRECLVSTGDFSRRSEAFRRAQAAVFSECYGDVARFKVFGAACVDFAFLSCGRTDVHVRFTNKIWDYLPGLYIAEKAGAVYDKELQRERDVLLLCSSREVLDEASERMLPRILRALERRRLLFPPIITRYARRASSCILSLLPSTMRNSISPVLSTSLTFSESDRLRSKNVEWICLMTSWPESPYSIMTFSRVSRALTKLPPSAVSRMFLTISGLAMPMVW